MKKVQFFAFFWTLALAIPFTVLALSGVALVTENLIAINQATLNFSQSVTAGGRGLLAEIAERWPEVAGMVIGQIVILTILLFARSANHAGNTGD
jgi:hypothetical protein